MGLTSVRPSDIPFAEAVAQTRPSLLAAARRLCRGSEADAEDLVHDALARALRSQGSYDPARPLVPWMRRALLRLHIDRLRASATHLASAAAPLEGQQATCDRQAKAEAVEQVRLLLDALGEPERSILLRFHQNGESIRELSSALSLPQGTIKSHLHRARQTLAARFTLGPGATLERRTERRS